MSDDEYNSDNNSGSEDSDNEIIIPSTKKPLFKPSINIKSYTKSYNDIDDSEPDDADPDDAEPEEDEEENIVGGADEIVSEDEASEEGGGKEADEDDDAEPEDEADESDIELTKMENQFKRFYLKKQKE